MKFLSGAVFPLVILSTLAALTLWLRQASDLSEVPVTNKERHDPDTLMEKFRAVTLDTHGHPLYRLEAEKLVHYPDDDSTEISMPSLYYTPTGQAPLHLRAQQGKLLNKNEVVELFNHVEVKRANTPTTPGWTIQLPYLTAYPKEARAESQSEVVFTQAGTRLTATGFSLDHKARTINLHAKVRGVLAPRSTPLEQP